MVHSCADCICLGNLLASQKEIGSERAIWRRRGEEWLPSPCEKKIIDLHLECNQGEILDTACGPTGFSAFMRPRAYMFVARCVSGCIVWMCS